MLLNGLAFGHGFDGLERDWGSHDNCDMKYLEDGVDMVIDAEGIDRLGEANLHWCVGGYRAECVMGNAGTLPLDGHQIPYVLEAPWLLAEVDGFLVSDTIEQGTCDRIHCTSSSDVLNHAYKNLVEVQVSEVGEDPGYSPYTIHKGNSRLLPKWSMVMRQIASTRTVAEDMLDIAAVVLEGNSVVDRHFLPYFVQDPCNLRWAVKHIPHGLLFVQQSLMVLGWHHPLSLCCCHRDPFHGTHGLLCSLYFHKRYLEGM